MKEDCKYLDGELDVEPSDDGTSEDVHGTVPVCMFHDGDKDACPYPERACPAKPPEDFEKSENFRDEWFEKSLEKSLKDNHEILKELSRPYMDTLFITSVGSHMWGAQTPKSDADLWLVYRAPLRGVLLGQAFKSKQEQKGEIDLVVHEAGKVVHQLKKSNINFLWGTLSPIVVEEKQPYLGWLSELRQIATENMSKQVYHSIHGLAMHNYVRYIMGDSVQNEREHGEILIQKKMNIIARTVAFGTRILDGEAISFTPYQGIDYKELKTMMEDLDKAHKESKLPEKPPHPEKYDEWLVRLRLQELD